MRMELTDKEMNHLLHALLDLGETMLISGAEINRVEDTLIRLGMAYGARKMNVFVITSSIVITMAFPEGLEVTQTRRILDCAGNDFTRLEQLNHLSRTCCSEQYSVAEFQQKIDEIRNAPVSDWPLFAGSMLGTFSFAVFFGGTFGDGLAAAFFAVAICFLQTYMRRICPNTMVFNLLTAFLIGLGITLLAELVPGLHSDKIMIGDIMLLIPGIAMTNAIRDVLVGDTISGAMRLIESLLWAGSLACGFMISMWILGGAVR